MNRKQSKEFMKLSDAIAVRLKGLLETRQITQYRLSKATGIPHSTVSQIMCGYSPSPKVSTLIPIVWGLGLTLSEFFNDELFDEGKLNL